MCNLALIRNQYAPRNVDSSPNSKLIFNHLPGYEPEPSACKLSVQTTTPPVFDTILIEEQAIILPR